MKIRINKTREIYISTKIKFLISLVMASLWFVLSLYISRPWFTDLSQITGPLLAHFIIITIALIPGFMNFLLVVSLLLDRRPHLKLDRSYPPVSILIACYNEEKNIEETLQGIKNQDYTGSIEIIVADDGSTDRTIEKIENYDIGNLKIVRASHGGKASALNQGIKEVTNDIMITIDADTFLHKEAVKRIVARFLSDPLRTAAIAGTVLVRNSRENLMTKLQENDYFLAISSVKREQGLFQGTLVAQGAFSLYKKSAVMEVDGWPNVIGEDIVVTWALLKKGYRVGFEPTAVGFTNVPTTYKLFAKQRRRWARGMIEGLKAHLDMTYKRKNAPSFLVLMNLLFPILDISYVIFFIPGIVLALFGHFWIVGPLTLAVIPLTLGIMYVMLSHQKKVFKELGLNIRRNFLGFFLYAIIYQLLMSPVTTWGYLEEFAGIKKKW